MTDEQISQTEAQNNWIKEFYVSEDKVPELENALVKIPGRILPICEVQGTNDIGDFARNIAECFAYFKGAFKFHHGIKFALSEAPYHNACAVGSTDTVVITLLMLDRLLKFSSRISTSAQFDKIYSPQYVSIRNRNGRKFRRQAIKDLLDASETVPFSGKIPGVMAYIIRFITFHEMGHLVNGHVRAGIGNVSTMSEAQEILEHDTYLTQRTLEFDADSFGAHHTLEISLYEVKNHDVLNSRGYVGALIGVTIGAYLVMCSFDTRDDPIKGKFLTHSPAPVRMFLLEGTLVFEAGLASKRYKIPEPRYFVQNAIRATENAISEIGRSDLNPSMFDGWIRASRTEHQAILSRWAKIRPDLMKVKYVENELAAAVRPPG